MLCWALVRVGKAMAADCALAGQKVRICDLEPFAEKTHLVSKSRVSNSMVISLISMVSPLRPGNLDRVTTDVTRL